MVAVLILTIKGACIYIHNAIQRRSKHPILSSTFDDHLKTRGSYFHSLRVSVLSDTPSLRVAAGNLFVIHVRDLVSVSNFNRFGAFLKF